MINKTDHNHPTLVQQEVLDSNKVYRRKFSKPHLTYPFYQVLCRLTAYTSARKDAISLIFWIVSSVKVMFIHFYELA